MLEDQRKQEAEPMAFEYEVSKDLSAKVMQEIAAFISTEKEKWRALPPEVRREQKYAEHMNSFVLSANNTLEEIKKRGDLEKSFAVFCRQGDRVIGVSFVGITPENKVPGDVFFGVAFDQIKKGIATELVRQMHETLRAKGIKEYKVAVWLASKLAIEKALGQPIMHDPNSMGSGFIVKLS